MYKLVLLLLVPFLFSACKKSESPDPNDPARNGEHFPGPKASVLISKQWKLTDKKVVYDNGLPTEDFSNVPDCTKDNLISFAQNKKYTIDEAIDVCPGNNQTTTLDWTTTNEEQTVVMNNKNWSLISVSNTTMVLQYINSSQSLTVTTTETYTAQ